MLWARDGGAFNSQQAFRDANRLRELGGEATERGLQVSSLTILEHQNTYHEVQRCAQCFISHHQNYLFEATASQEWYCVSAAGMSEFTPVGKLVWEVICIQAKHVNHLASKRTGQICTLLSYSCFVFQKSFFTPG